MPTSTSNAAELDELKDSELLRRYVDHRDERAFSLLFDRWNQKLVGWTARKIGDWSTAEEIVQDTWSQVHKHAHRFEWSRKFSAWLYTICDNLIKNEHRSRSRSPVTLFNTLRAKWRPDDMDRPLQWADKTYAPDKEAQQRELEHRVMEATEQLKPQHRVVFVLREFEGLEYEEIEEMTGVKLGTVKSRLSRARQHFRDALLDAGLAAADLDQLEIPEVEVPSDETTDETVDMDVNVNVNTAGERELCGLPDVGPVVAQSIIEARPFESVEELAEIDWLSPWKVEKLRPHVILSEAEPAQLEETVNGPGPLRTVQWRKGYNGLSAVHAVRSADAEVLELLLACGGELSVQEREGVELNPEPEPTCQRCQLAVESDEPVAA